MIEIALDGPPDTPLDATSDPPEHATGLGDQGAMRRTGRFGRPPREVIEPVLMPVQEEVLRWHEVSPDQTAMPTGFRSLARKLKEYSGLTWKAIAANLGRHRQNVDIYGRSRRMTHVKLGTFVQFVYACGGRVWVEFPMKDK